MTEKILTISGTNLKNFKRTFRDEDKWLGESFFFFNDEGLSRKTTGSAHKCYKKIVPATSFEPRTSNSTVMTGTTK